MLRRRSIEAHVAELNITSTPRSVVRPAIHTSFSGFLEIDQELASENAEKSRASRSAQDICGEWSDVCDGSIDDLADMTLWRVRREVTRLISVYTLTSRSI